MRLDQVGHFFILGFRGPVIPVWLREFEKNFGLGGVILFDYDCQTRTYENNIYSPLQLKALCSELRELPSHPLIFIDQEGGKVRRLKEKLGFTPLPSQYKLNTLPHDEKAHLIENSFKEMKDLGIHFNLAPVIDLNLNPANPDIGAIERSYSADPYEVRTNVELINRIARKVQLGLCLKHYPGLGGATVNSHDEITDLTDSINDTQIELFYELGEIIFGQAILVSHGIVETWEPHTPVSMSAIAVNQLRKRLPNALLISDDLQMQGLQKRWTSRAASTQAIRAGLDLICIGNNLMAEDEAVAHCAEAVATELTKDPTLRSNAMQSLARISAKKLQFTGNYPKDLRHQEVDRTLTI